MTTELSLPRVGHAHAEDIPDSAGTPVPFRVRIRYFAALRDQSGRAEELWQTTETSAASLFEQVKQRYGFALQAEHVRLAVNGRYCVWDTVLAEGDEVVFVPPVSGG